ncbi:hypothetical protein QHF85_16900 [Polyangium sp. 6x1]|nr:hypothetical protein [Polyangium sp. 6x1]MDI1445738.1 hypothetical protein [Polyangium sp. 6x1]
MRRQPLSLHVAGDLFEKARERRKPAEFFERRPRKSDSLSLAWLRVAAHVMGKIKKALPGDPKKIEDALMDELQRGELRVEPHFFEELASGCFDG